jgi:hypothetical protein
VSDKSIQPPETAKTLLPEMNLKVVETYASRARKCPMRCRVTGPEFITSSTFEHSVVRLLEFVEADAIAEGINDIQRPGSIEFILNTGTQIAITFCRKFAVEVFHT